jgi:hypothetical protein
VVSPEFTREDSVALVLQINDLVPEEHRPFVFPRLMLLAARAEGTGPFEGMAILEQRIRRVTELNDQLTADIAEPCLLADTPRCIRVVSAAVELFRESRGRLPSHRETIDTLAELGVPDAEATFNMVWDLDAFSIEWARIGAMPAPLSEALIGAKK